MIELKPLPDFDFAHFGFNEGALFDLIFPDPYPVGLNRSYPNEFVARVFSALVSYKLGNKSIDYTRKKYAEYFEFESKSEIRAAIETFMDMSEHFLDEVVQGHRDDKIGENHAGLVLFDVYVFRAFDSLRAAALLSNHGYFGEAMSVLRYFVEQAAWLTVIICLADADKIVKVKAEASIASAKRIFPKIGDLYGFLSEATHFRPDHHAAHLNIAGEQLAAIRRSARFSALGFCATVVCVGYLINLVLSQINCQYTYEKEKFNYDLVPLYDSITQYFRTNTDSLFIARVISCAESIQPDFAPWPMPIFDVTKTQ